MLSAFLAFLWFLVSNVLAGVLTAGVLGALLLVYVRYAARDRWFYNDYSFAKSHGRYLLEWRVPVCPEYPDDRWQALRQFDAESNLAAIRFVSHLRKTVFRHHVTFADHRLIRLGPDKSVKPSRDHAFVQQWNQLVPPVVCESHPDWVDLLNKTPQGD